MDARENLLTRRSIRSYKNDPIPTDVLDRILEAGTYAASGMGQQPAIILAITDRATRDKLSRLNQKARGGDTDPFYGAPVVLAVLAAKERPTYIYDGSLVIGNLMLAAHAEGLGSCWIHGAKEEFELPEGRALLERLGIDPDAYEGIGHCILGYPAGDEPQAAPRKEQYIYRV